MMDTLDTDILILGAGGAGLFAALHAKKARHLKREMPTPTHGPFAQAACVALIC